MSQLNTHYFLFESFVLPTGLQYDSVDSGSGTDYRHHFFLGIISIQKFSIFFLTVLHSRMFLLNGLKNILHRLSSTTTSTRYNHFIIIDFCFLFFLATVSASLSTLFLYHTFLIPSFFTFLLFIIIYRGYYLHRAGLHVYRDVRCTFVARQCH